MPNGHAPEAVRSAYATLKEWLDTSPAGVLRHPPQPGRTVLPPHRHHLRGLWRQPVDRAPHPVRHHPAGADQARVVASRARAEAARRGAQRVPARPLRRAGDASRPASCPADLIYRNPHYRLEMLGFEPPHGVYVHIAGIDVVRVDEDTFYVLEDNARTPSGVSYMLENREVMIRLFPELFAQPPGRAGRELPGRPSRDAALGRAADREPRSDRGAADARAASTRPSTSTRSSPTSSASSSSRPPTSSPRTTSSSCARRKGRSGST